MFALLSQLDILRFDGQFNHEKVIKSKSTLGNYDEDVA